MMNETVCKCGHPRSWHDEYYRNEKTGALCLAPGCKCSMFEENTEYQICDHGIFVKNCDICYNLEHEQ